MGLGPVKHGVQQVITSRAGAWCATVHDAPMLGKTGGGKTVWAIERAQSQREFLPLSQSGCLL